LQQLQKINASDHVNAHTVESLSKRLWRVWTTGTVLRNAMFSGDSQRAAFLSAVEWSWSLAMQHRLPWAIPTPTSVHIMSSLRIAPCGNVQSRLHRDFIVQLVRSLWGMTLHNLQLIIHKDCHGHYY
jgi:hypothetical protein